MGQLINIIPGSLLLILSLPSLAFRTYVDLLRKPHDSTSVLEALLVNLISNDTHLLISMYFQLICRLV